MGWATEDPKVRHEFGEGGAPPTVAKHLAVLDGYSRTMLDCELPKEKK